MQFLELDNALPSNGSDLHVLGAAEPDWLNPTGSLGPAPPDDAPDNDLSEQQDAPRPTASEPPLLPFQSTGLPAFGSVVGDIADFISSDAASLLHRMQGEEWKQGVGTLTPGSTSFRPSRRPSAVGRRTTPAMQPVSAAAADVLPQKQEQGQQQQGQGQQQQGQRQQQQQGQGQKQQQGQQCEIGVSELRGLPLDPGACINAGFDATGGERSGQQVQGHTYAVPVVPVVHEVPVVPRDPPESAISAPQPAGSRSVRQTRTSKVRRQCVCMCVVCVCGLYCTAANAAWHNRAHPPPVGMALLPGLCCL